MSNYKTVFFTLGVLLIVLGIAMLVPVGVQFFYNELNSTFIISSIITITFGVLFYLSNIDHNRSISTQQAFLLTALSWMGVAIFGSIPFFFSELNLSITDSIFESMSGITTTGATIIENLSATPKGILSWRAMLQWLGGIGIIVMAITLMPIMNIGGMQLLKISSGDAAEKILPKSKQISLRLTLIYLTLTLICAFFYKICGMNIFDSLTHSMTTIATGGFSNYNQSIGYFNNAKIEYVSIIFIILGSLPFIAYIKFLSSDKKLIFKDAQIKLFFKLIFFSVLVLFIYLSISNKNIFEVQLRSIIFNVISILTGTGYVTKEFDQWGNFPLIFFLLLMFIGGCAGSTTCGIKVFRVHMLFYFFRNQLLKIIYPRAVLNLKYNDEVVQEKLIASIISFIFLYIILFFLISALLTLTGLNFITAISGAASSISNVGPGLGSEIGPNSNYANLPASSKWILSAAMILGRLEIFAILVIFLPSFWRN
ncbi:TrkH family potassium uptake protein [Candidatus Pelagibacter communis]|uniref:TrkH family potassium uptake protein n=1 Tax=Pelagibacter ubique TaxID=198252 RepID=UPI00094CD7BF|nr:TrkH family potassium uptake protein [Candidatus Pelagibacter ubique]